MRCGDMHLLLGLSVMYPRGPLALQRQPCGVGTGYHGQVVARHDRMQIGRRSRASLARALWFMELGHLEQPDAFVISTVEISNFAA